MQSCPTIFCKKIPFSTEQLAEAQVKSKKLQVTKLIFPTDRNDPTDVIFYFSS